MELAHYTNPHVAGAAAPAPAPPEARIRLRETTLSPAEEYAARTGQAETIPDALAALILSRKTFVEVGLKGVTLNRNELGGKRKYWHPDSPLCNQIGRGEKRRIVAVWNDLDHHAIHLFDETGRYLETLPEEILPPALDDDALRDELAKHRRVAARTAEHLKRLHRADSEEALETARHNSAELLRSVTTLPAAETATHHQRQAAPTQGARDASAALAQAAETAARRGTTRAIADHAILSAPARETRPAPSTAPTIDPFDL